MANEVPSRASFVARFPAFSTVPDATLDVALVEAGNRVGASWTAADYPMGIMLYVAHSLTLDGQGTGAEAALGGAGALGFDHLQSGSLTLGRRAPSGPDAGNPLAETGYGRRFLALLRVNQPSVLVP